MIIPEPAAQPQTSSIIKLLEYITQILVGRIRVEGAVDLAFVPEIFKRQFPTHFTVIPAEFYPFRQRYIDGTLDENESEAITDIEETLEEILDEMSESFDQPMTVDDLLYEMTVCLSLDCLRLSLEQLQANPALGAQPDFSIHMTQALRWLWTHEHFFQFTDYPLFNVPLDFLLETTECLGIDLAAPQYFVNALYLCAQKIGREQKLIDWEGIKFRSKMLAFLEQLENPVGQQSAVNAVLETFETRLGKMGKKGGCIATTKEIKNFLMVFKNTFLLRIILGAGDGIEKTNEMPIEEWRVHVWESASFTRYLRANEETRENILHCFPTENLEAENFPSFIEWCARVFPLDHFREAIGQLNCNENPAWKTCLGDEQRFFELVRGLDADYRGVIEEDCAEDLQAGAAPSKRMKR